MTAGAAARSAATTRMRRLIPVAKRVARVAGISLGRYPPINTTPHHLKYLLRELDISFVLDVGAHRGEYVRLLRDHARFSGHIASFEPASESYAQLLAACARDPRWRGYAYALGRDPGRAELNLFGMTQLNSLLPPSRYGMEVFPELGRPAATQKVEVCRLDEVFDEVTSQVRDPRVLLKIDTQGSDLRVLEGAMGVLDRVHALQVEVPLKPIYDGMAPLPELLGLLGELGYELTGVFPLARDPDHLRILELDCVLYRPAAATGGRPSGGARG
jgi:FkbM family methyltransferase